MRTSTLDGLFAIQYTTLTAGTLLATFLLTLGATGFQIGLVAALPLLSGLLQPAGAEFIRSRGGWRKPVCLAAALVDALLWVVSLAAVVWLPSAAAVLLLIGVLTLQYAASAFVGVAWTSWISDLVPLRLRGRYFGTRNFICNAFGAATAAVAGQAIRAAGENPLPIFLWAIGAGVLFRLVSIYFLSQQPEPRPAQSASGGFLKQMRQPLAHPCFRRYLAFATAWGFAVNLAAPFFTVYMVREAGVGIGAVMAFAALGTISNLVGQRVWGPLCDRYGDRQVMRVAGLSVVLQPLWWLFTGPSGLAYYLMPLLSITGGFAWGGYALATGNLMMRLAPEIGKTSFFATQAALGGLFGALGPFVGGLLASALSGGTGPLPSGLFADAVVGLKGLFLVSFAFRLGAWGLLHRVPEPRRGPRLRAAFVIRDTVRTFNPTQGFSPLLHVFAPTAKRRRAPGPHRSSPKCAVSRPGLARYTSAGCEAPRGAAGPAAARPSGA